MEIFKTFQDLVDDVFFVYFFKYVCSDDGVHVYFHKIKHQVYIFIVLGSHHIQQADYVLVACELLQKYDFSEGALSVCRILKSIEVLLKRYNLPCALVHGFPDNAISPCALFLEELVAFEHMGFYFFVFTAFVAHLTR